MDSKKSFGLIIPKKTKVFNPKTSGIFGSDSDDDSTTKKKMPKIPQSKPIPSKTTKMEELVDPSIYEYDSIYDDMKAQKLAEIAPKEKKSARYIDCLLKAADKRKKEYERRLEKKVQVEREKEGDKFKDKEMFVTSTYKKKMLEREEEEERERRENQLNDMMDVTKQKDLSGFYRHFLKQSIGEEKVPVFGEKRKIKEEPRSSSDNEQTPCATEAIPVADVQNSVPDDSDSEKSSDDQENSASNSYEKSQRIRKYRKRSDSDHNEEDSDDDTGDHSKTSTNRPNKRTIKELSGRSHDSEVHTKLRKNSNKETSSETTLDQQSSHKRTREKSEGNTSKSIPKLLKSCSDKDSVNSEENEKDLSPKGHRERNDSDSSDVSNSSDEQKRGVEILDNKTVENGVKNNDSDKENNSKPSRNIYEKRTVGDNFAAAQARYFQRLSARS